MFGVWYPICVTCHIPCPTVLTPGRMLWYCTFDSLEMKGGDNDTYLHGNCTTVCQVEWSVVITCTGVSESVGGHVTAVALKIYEHTLCL